MLGYIGQREGRTLIDIAGSGSPSKGEVMRVVSWEDLGVENFPGSQRPIKDPT